MNRLILAVATAALLSGPATAQEGPVRVLGVAPFSAEGNAWRSGVELALREINARGGMLGRQIVIAHADTVPASAAPHDLILSQGPAGNPSIPAITIAAPASTAAKLAHYAAEKLKTRTVAVVTESAEERAALAVRLQARGITVTDIPAEEQQVDFSATVIRLRNSGAEAVLVMLPEAESARLLQELWRQKYDKPVVGGPALLAPRLAELAGDAVNGVRAIAALDPATPIPAVRDTSRRYEEVYRTARSLEALRGYSALYAARTLAAKAGRLDREAFTAILHREVLEARSEPGLLLDAAGGNGALDHQTLVFELRDRLPVIVDSLPPGAG